jgi:hypothetical protein
MFNEGGCEKIAPNEYLYSTLLRKKLRSSRPWMNALRVPYEARTSAVGYASEGSACLREAASAKAGPTKRVEDLRVLARGAPLL